MRAERAWWRVESPRGRAGAIGLIALEGRDEAALDGALRAVAGRGVAPGAWGVRALAGVDEGVVARWSGVSAHLMPHGGRAVLAALAAALEGMGIHERSGEAWPEAGTPIEARMLGALARARSPLAIDLLLDQPAAWAREGRDEAGPMDARDAALRRLIEPAVVVAVGAANIGKSSLLNALAGRGVAAVADEPGTTRDHVGVELDLGGLVVRWVDTPGLGAGGDGLDARAQRAVGALVASADLVVACGDAGEAHGPRVEGALRVALRGDRVGAAPGWAEVVTSAARGDGLEALGAAVRERLTPTAWRSDGRAWRFW